MERTVIWSILGFKGFTMGCSWVVRGWLGVMGLAAVIEGLLSPLLLTQVSAPIGALIPAFAVARVIGESLDLRQVFAVDIRVPSVKANSQPLGSDFSDHPQRVGDSEYEGTLGAVRGLDEQAQAGPVGIVQQLDNTLPQIGPSLFDPLPVERHPRAQADRGCAQPDRIIDRVLDVSDAVAANRFVRGAEYGRVAELRRDEIGDRHLEPVQQRPEAVQFGIQIVAVHMWTSAPDFNPLVAGVVETADGVLQRVIKVDKR